MFQPDSYFKPMLVVMNTLGFDLFAKVEISTKDGFKYHVGENVNARVTTFAYHFPDAALILLVYCTESDWVGHMETRWSIRIEGEWKQGGKIKALTYDTETRDYELKLYGGWHHTGWSSQYHNRFTFNIEKNFSSIEDIHPVAYWIRNKFFEHVEHQFSEISTNWGPTYVFPECGLEFYKRLGTIPSHIAKIVRNNYQHLVKEDAI